MKSLVALMLVAASLPSAAMAQVHPSQQDAIIWFYRPADSPLPQDIPTVLEVGGVSRQLARLAPGEFFGYIVQPGTHRFSYTRAPARGQSLSMVVKAASQVYVEVHFRALNVVSVDLGGAVVRKLSPISKPAVLDRNVTTSLGDSSTPIVRPSPQIAASAATTIVTGPAIAPATVIVELPATAAGSTIIALPTNVTSTKPATQVPAQHAKPALPSGGTPPTKSAEPVTVSAPLVARAPSGIAAPTGPVIASTSSAPPVVTSSTSTATPALSAQPVSPPTPAVLPKPVVSSTTSAASARSDRNGASGAPTSAVQPDASPRKDSSIAPRANKARPAWPEQPGTFTEVFSNAILKMQTGDKKQELEATVAFDKTGFWLLDPRGTTLKAFPYDSIRIAEYSSSKSPRWRNVGSGAPVATSASGSRYSLMVQTQSDYALISLDRNDLRSVVGAFEMRSGKTVEISAESK